MENVMYWVWWDFVFSVLCVVYVMTNTASETRLTYHAKCTRLYDESKEAKESEASTQHLASGITRALPVSLIYPMFCFFSVVLSSKRMQMHVIGVPHSHRAVLCCVSVFHSSSSMPKCLASLIHGTASSDQVFASWWCTHSTAHRKARGKRRYVYK